MYVGQHGGTRQCSAWRDIASFPGVEEGEENEAKRWSAWQDTTWSAWQDTTVSAW